MNDRGDWIVPMSSELKVFDYVDSFSSYIYLGNGFISIKKRNDYFSSSCVIYDFLNDEVICVIDGDCSPIIAVDNYIFFEDESYNLCKIDTQTKEILETSFNAARCYFDNAFLYKDRSKDDIYYLYNYNFECILTINYEIHSGYCYSDDRFSALCYGKDDDTYLCLFNNDGTFAFEPIHVEPGYNVYISNEHILYMGNWNTAIYDFNGNLTSEFDGYNLNLDKESGILRSSGLSAYSDRNCFFDIDGNRMSISAKSEVPEDGTSPYNDLFTNS